MSPVWVARTWSEQKARVRRAVAAVAAQVVELHRQRALATGHAYEKDTPWQGELESSPFPSKRPSIS